MTTNSAFVPRGTGAARRSDAALGDSKTVRESKTYRKWESMLARGLDRFLATHSQTFLRRLRRGAPQEFRWEVWKTLLQSKLLDESPISGASSPQSPHKLEKRESPQISQSSNNSSQLIDSQQESLFPSLFQISLAEYSALAEKESSFYNLIQIDVPRTFPEIPIFDKSAQQQLLRILNAFANYNPAVGYCQGMNFTVGFLLLVADFREYEVFAVTAVLFDHYGVEGLYRENFPLLSKYIEVYDAVAAETVPDLWNHFLSEGVLPPVYLHQWFLTLFVRGLPLRTVVVIWDFLLAEGLQSLIPLTIALLRVLQRFLIRLKFEDAVKFLKSLKSSGDCDETEIGRMLVRQAEKVEIPSHLLLPLMDVDIAELVREAAEKEARAQALRASPARNKICAASLDEVAGESSEPNPLLQYLEAEEEDIGEEFTKETRKHRNSRPGTYPATVPPPSHYEDLLQPRIKSNDEQWLRQTATYLGQTDLTPSEVNHRSTFNRSQYSQYGHPGPSVWASSGYNRAAPSPQFPLQSPSREPSDSSWFPVYNSPVWKFPYPQRQDGTTTLTSVEPVRYTGNVSQTPNYSNPPYHSNPRPRTQERNSNGNSPRNEAAGDTLMSQLLNQAARFF